LAEFFFFLSSPYGTFKDPFFSWRLVERNLPPLFFPSFKCSSRYSFAFGFPPPLISSKELFAFGWGSSPPFVSPAPKINSSHNLPFLPSLECRRSLDHGLVLHSPLFFFSDVLPPCFFPFLFRPPQWVTWLNANFHSLAVGSEAPSSSFPGFVLFFLSPPRS